MKRGIGVVLLIILVSTLAIAVTKTTTYSLPVNTARIFDFTNDGFNDALAFSDRIDNRLSAISLYSREGNKFIKAKDLTTQQLKHCSLSYQDANNDSYIDIFYSCLNSSNHVVSNLLIFNGTDYTEESFITTNSFASQSYGDVLFFDFTNNGYPDIISCFLTQDGNLTFYQNTGETFTNTSSPIEVNQFEVEPNKLACYLVPADLNADGFLDILTYSYDANSFNTYLNTQTGSFTQANPEDFFNLSFFSTKKIKALQAYDNNGYSNLYYVIDLNTTSNPRAIEFGYFPNKQANTSEIQITEPEFIINYTGQHDPAQIQFSWENQTKGFFEIQLINTSKILSNGTQILAAITHNLAIDGSNYIYGDFYNSSYDYNAQRGNLLYRTTANISLLNTGFSATAQGIGPSGIISNSSESILYKPFYTYNKSFAAFGQTFYPEFCDGRDTNLDGIVDGPFEMIWPDGSKQNLSFTKNKTKNCYTQASYTFTYNSWSIKIPCTNVVICSPDPITKIRSTASSSAITQQEPSTTISEPATVETQAPPETQPEKQTKQFPTTQKQFEQTFTITYNNNRTFVEEKIKNIRRTPLSSVIVRKEFNTSTLARASDLESINTFIIIRENPIIEFEIEGMDYLQSQYLTYSIPGTHTVEEIQNTITSFRANQEFTDEQIAELELAQQQKASESLTTIIQEKIENNQTVLTVSVDLEEGIGAVYDVEVEQYIPKCLLHEITDTILEAGIDSSLLNSVQIKEADPIIVWNFKELRQGQELTLTLSTLRDEDCEDEVLIKTLARDYIKQNYEINQQNLLKSLGITAGTILVLIILFVIATRDLTKNKEPRINRLVKIILLQRHKNIPDNIIRQNLIRNKELPSEIAEAFTHISTLHAFKKHKLTHHVTERGVEIIFFFLLLALNLAEFTGLLPGYLDWFKKLISWSLLLTILYKADITKILFNISLPKINLTILLAMMLMHLKNIVAFAEKQSLEWQTTFIYDLYTAIINQQEFFTTTVFFIGALILLIPSIYLGFTLQPREGSLFYILSKKHTHNLIEKLAQTSTIYILLLIFFFSVFNRIMEWLAVSIDAAVFILALIVLLAILAGTTFTNKHKEEHSFLALFEKTLANNLGILILGAFFIFSIFKPFVSEQITKITFAWLIGIILATVLYVLITNIRQRFTGVAHISTAIDTVYLKFIKLFKYPGTVFLGISGLFILQQIVEIVIYLIPNITGKSSTLYGHTGATLFTLFTNNSIVAMHLFQLSFSEKILYGSLYVLGIIGFFMLFFIPVYIWILYFKNRAHHPTKISIAQIFTNKVIGVVAIPTIVVALITDVLTFSHITDLTSVGVIIEAQKIILPPHHALWLLCAIAIYLLVIPFVQSHRIRVYITAWISILALIVFYLTPFVQSMIKYIHTIVTSIMIPLSPQSSLSIIISIFFIKDILIIYGLGLTILLFLILPVSLKQKILKIGSYIPIIHRTMFLASDVRHLEYYDDAKEHLSGNLIHHLEKYVQGEIRDGHHVETIIYQMKLHSYPNHIIQEAIKDLSNNPRFTHEVDHFHPKNVRIEMVKELISKVKKIIKEKSAQEIYELFNDTYKYYEIKLALRYATKELKRDLAIEIKLSEREKINTLARWIHDAFLRRRTREQIQESLLAKAWDLELVMKIIDNPLFREKEFDVDKAKILARKKTVSEKELRQYSYPELIYAKKTKNKKLLLEKKKAYEAPYDAIGNEIESNYLRLQ